MSDLRKAAEMALERLEHTIAYSNEEMKKIDDAKHALRQALVQPEQEPVAWMYVEPNNPYKTVHTDKYDYKQMRWDDEWFPVYTAPPKREWVGLTEEEFSDLLYFDGRLDHVEVPLIADFIRAIQAKLKEKNGG